MALRLAPINHRWQLADLLNERGMLDMAVEIGTHRGEYAEEFRRVWKGKELYCVDPWANPPGYEEQAKYLTGGGEDREADYIIAQDKVGHLEVCFVRRTSEQAVELFKANSVDLVYLDGDHSYLGVKSDMVRWWPKLKPGGILAGHDFITGGTVDTIWNPFVQKAAFEFATTYNLDIFLVIENSRRTAGYPWTFYMEKPK